MKHTIQYIAIAGILGFASGSFAQTPPKINLRPEAPELMLKRSGLQVVGVVPYSPAAAQGFEVGDIIVKVNGKPVRSLADLHYLIGRSGYVARLEVIDCNTGRPTQVHVYPSAGKIGVAVRPISLDNQRPWGPRPFVLGDSSTVHPDA